MSDGKAPCEGNATNGGDHDYTIQELCDMGYPGDVAENLSRALVLSAFKGIIFSPAPSPTPHKLTNEERLLFNRVRGLDLSGTKVTNLAPLAGVGFIYCLDLSGTNVTDLSPIAGCKNLNTLCLRNLGDLPDLSPLEGMDSVEVLDLSGTNVTDLSPLVKMKRLERLSIHGTNVADLSPLSGTNVDDLDLSGMAVTDLSPLRGMGIKWLNLFNCRNLTDVSPLKGMKSLTWLDLDGTPLEGASLKDVIEGKVPPVA